MNQIYIEKNFLDKEELLSFILAEKFEKIYFSLWFYPETDKRAIKKVRKKLEKYFYKNYNLAPVTFYDNEHKDSLKQNQLFYFNNELKEIILKNKNYLDRKCDSITFYLDNQSEWIIADIFHEQMLIAKDNDVIVKQLKEKNINFSEEAPIWW